ncbi:hypothetical protein DOTSEDRAFT_26574 [Dothistroma septosporum NZE10]|uniref:C3H1-type domain-containing protein n=1 Tax=Dothistroma septosporum (strain NZE10 / CBS 128990) TaxID=675120 RepID=N1PGY8_DOTSN|nr:hypothetical protein DOTSEDRAFT_26574 [Dothistroma septosporum NZE10]
MDSATKQSKTLDAPSPSKTPQKKRRNNSPDRKNTAQTSNLEDTLIKGASHHAQATNKFIVSPKKKNPQNQISPVKAPPGREGSAGQRPVLSRAYTSPIKQRRNSQGQIICVFWPQGRCVYGESCLFVHERDRNGEPASLESQARHRGEDQSAKPAARPVRSELLSCCTCGATGHYRGECPSTSASASSDAATSQLNAEVSKILAENSSISLADEDTFFESLEQTNSQAFTDHQIHGKLTDSTIRRLLVHAYAVRQASQDAMKFACQSCQTDDYEKADALDELAKEILNTPGLPFDQKTKERIVEAVARPFG